MAKVCFNGGMDQTQHIALHIEADRIATTMENGNRGDAREAIDEHSHPVALTLAVIRHLVTEHGADALDAVVNVQALTERLDR